MSAAQIAVIAAALVEQDTPATQEGAGAQSLRQQQPRVKSREILLAIARQNDPGVVDARER